MKIYISIPMTGHDLATQRAKAAEIAEQIRALGHEPVNPFDTPEPPAGLSETKEYAYYMLEDIKRLWLCDAIFMCEGWENSYGCNIELEVAVHNGCSVYEDIGRINHIDKYKNLRTILSMEEHESGIIVFPKVKNYHTVKLEDILTEGKIVGNGVIEEIAPYKRECRVNFIGELAESKKPMPIGFVSEEHGIMILMPKAEVSINGSKAVVKWHKIKRRKKLTGYIIIPITPE
ncbi:MAG: DUF4406 domain-containing protein [Muribaculaceae bacterium]|nr:DUF4406 domain-containing protein [Muribaculaceae bacterium]